MAVDTSLYAATIPAGSYAKGDVVTLANIKGPAVVRDGYGTALLKRIICGSTSVYNTANVIGHVTVKNSNWVDEVSNLIMPPSAVALAENSSNMQVGHDAILTPNSGWEVTFTFDAANTTTTATDVFALIDIDYPKVAAVQNPREAKGDPATIMRTADTVDINAYGSLNASGWKTYNVDILKAGWRYLLVELGAYIPGSAVVFLSISGSATQNGLERIIPALPNNTGNLRFLLDYSTPLVKGPMNLNYLAIGTAATGVSVTLEMDFVKRQ